MEAADATAFLVIRKPDFLKAVRTIKPRRLTKTAQMSKVQLGAILITKPCFALTARKRAAPLGASGWAWRAFQSFTCSRC